MDVVDKPGIECCSIGPAVGREVMQLDNLQPSEEDSWVEEIRNFEVVECAEECCCPS